jgi:hypothetical protein
MPNSKIKVKSGNQYLIAYKVLGAIQELSREDLEKLALASLRASARQFILRALNEGETEVVKNQTLLTAMVESGFASKEKAMEFFSMRGMSTVLPTSFEIPLAELLPEDSGRGKKASDLFSFEGDEDGEEAPEAEA